LSFNIITNRVLELQDIIRDLEFKEVLTCVGCGRLRHASQPISSYLNMSSWHRGSFIRSAASSIGPELQSTTLERQACVWDDFDRCGVWCIVATRDAIGV